MVSRGRSYRKQHYGVRHKETYENNPDDQRLLDHNH